jgi:hypothetical protein
MLRTVYTVLKDYSSLYSCPPPLRPDNEMSHIEKYDKSERFPLLKRVPKGSLWERGERGGVFCSITFHVYQPMR